MNTTDTASQTIRDIVMADGAAAHLFERYGIAYFDGQGQETLRSVCEKKGLNLETVLSDMAALKRTRPYSFLHGDLWDEEFLIEYIVENHHRYCHATIPVLSKQLEQVCELEGERFPNLKLVRFLFQRAIHEIEQHMRKEEMILFPYFKSLASAQEFARQRPRAPFSSLDGPIERMTEEHEETAQIFSKIRALLDDFTVPEKASQLHASVIQGLEAFINDLHQHVHLENNLLFPRILVLEQSFDDRTGMPRVNSEFPHKYKSYC